MRKMKTLAALFLAAMISFSAYGCGLIKKATSTTPWQDEVSTKLPDKMTEDNIGTFYLDGDMYSFPMKVQAFLNNGWTYDSDRFREDTVLSHTWYEYKVELKKDKKLLSLEVYNTEDTISSIDKCTVGYLCINSFSGNAMFPGGFFISGTSGTEISGVDDMHAMAEEGFVFDNEDTASSEYSKYEKSFHGEEGRKCLITITVQKGAITGVVYDCSFTIDIGDYVHAVIFSVADKDPSYITDFNSNYDGDSFIAGYRAALAEDFVYYVGFDLTELTDEEYEMVYQYIDEVYSHAGFSISVTSTSTEDVVHVTYFAPDNFDDMLNEVAEITIEQAGGEITEESLADPEFFDMFMTNMLAKLPEFTYSLPRIDTLTYSGAQDDDQFDSDLYDIQLRALGLYEYF